VDTAPLSCSPLQGSGMMLRSCRELLKDRRTSSVIHLMGIPSASDALKIVISYLFIEGLQNLDVSFIFLL
jgi:hypothetical protein